MLKKLCCVSQDKQGVWCILMQCDIQKTLNKARNKLEKTEENEIYQRVLVATGDLLPEQQLEPASIKKFIVLSREISEEETTTMCESNTTSTTQITVTIHRRIRRVRHETRRRLTSQKKHKRRRHEHRFN